MRTSFLPVLVSVLLLSSGCNMFTKTKPIAAEVEESFKNRWIARRMGELQAAGKAADAREARVMALEEFKKTFEYTRVSKKPDPMSGAPAAR